MTSGHFDTSTDGWIGGGTEGEIGNLKVNLTRTYLERQDTKKAKPDYNVVKIDRMKKKSV